MSSGCSSYSNVNSTGESGSGDPALRPYLALDLTDQSLSFRSTPLASDTPDRFIVFKLMPTGTYLATTEVTHGQWSLFVGSTPWAGLSSPFITTAGSLAPAENITFAEAQSCASSAAIIFARRIRLPTPAELSAGLTAVTSSERITGWNVRESNRGGTVAVDRAGTEAGMSGLIGNVREWASTGILVGGGWLDNVVLTGQSLSTIIAERHPLSGVRLALDYP